MTISIHGKTPNLNSYTLAGFTFDAASRRIILPFPREETPHVTYDYPYGTHRCLRIAYLEFGRKSKSSGQMMRLYIKTSCAEFNREYTQRITEYGRLPANDYALEMLRKGHIKFNSPSNSTFHDIIWLETIQASRQVVVGQEIEIITVVEPHTLTTSDAPYFWQQFQKRLRFYEPSPLQLVFLQHFAELEQRARLKNSIEWAGVDEIFEGVAC